jgi:hypothetical protein
MSNRSVLIIILALGALLVLSVVFLRAQNPSATVSTSRFSWSSRSSVSSVFSVPRASSAASSSISPSPASSAIAVFLPPPRTQTSGCTASGGLPDHECTPGAVFPDATKEKICTPGYAASVRDVPGSLKAKVYAEYGIGAHRTGEYEVDHLISLELGGSNDIANLFPEAAEPRPGFHEKDTVENALHDAVCEGRMRLSEVQRIISENWLQALQK